MNSAANISNSNRLQGLKGRLMSASASVSFSDHHAKMVAAFDLIEPAGDWRDPIFAAISHAACAAAGVTLADVVESVEYFTATVAKVTEDDFGLVTVTADGYRNGPAGC